MTTFNQYVSVMNTKNGKVCKMTQVAVNILKKQKKWINLEILETPPPIIQNTPIKGKFKKQPDSNQTTETTTQITTEDEKL